MVLSTPNTLPNDSRPLVPICSVRFTEIYQFYENLLLDDVYSLDLFLILYRFVKYCNETLLGDEFKSLRLYCRSLYRLASFVLHNKPYSGEFIYLSIYTYNVLPLAVRNFLKFMIHVGLIFCPFCNLCVSHSHSFIPLSFTHGPLSLLDFKSCRDPDSYRCGFDHSDDFDQSCLDKLHPIVEGFSFTDFVSCDFDLGSIIGTAKFSFLHEFDDDTLSCVDPFDYLTVVLPFGNKRIFFPCLDMDFTILVNDHYDTSTLSTRRCTQLFSQCVENRDIRCYVDCDFGVLHGHCGFGFLYPLLLHCGFDSFVMEISFHWTKVCNNITQLSHLLKCRYSHFLVKGLFRQSIFI